MNVVTKPTGDSSQQDDQEHQKTTTVDADGDDAKEQESKNMSPSPSDESLTRKKKKVRVIRKDITRGMIPINNSPIKVRCLNGEESILS